MKTILGNLLLVGLSLSAVVVAEVVLRNAEYGYEPNLFAANHATGRYELNPEIYRKYFSSDPLVARSRIPHLFSEREFRIEKLPNEFRVFTFGGSTTRGDESISNFPDLIEQILERTQPGMIPEVVNLGITTLNSHHAVDFMREVVGYEPDLFVLYVGHNEIYGPQGAHSSFATAAWLGPIVFELRRFKVFQFLEINILEVRRSFDRDRWASLLNLMAKSPVPVDSAIRTIAFARFAANLTTALETARANEIPVVLSTVVSNVKALRPFQSDAPGPAGERARALSRDVQPGGHEAVLEAYTAAVDEAPTSAILYFELAELALAAGDVARAQAAFRRARDLDLIPFRAPSGINGAILDVAAGFPEVHLIDVLGEFQARSADGIVGKELVYDHLHPTSLGHYVIAVQAIDALADAGVIQAPEVDFFERDVRESFGVGLRAERFSGKDFWPFSIHNDDYRYP